MTPHAVVVGAGNIGVATGRLWRHLGGDVAYWDTSVAVRQSLQRAGHVTMDALALNDGDLVFVCVPTPTIAGRFAAAHLEAALAEIADAAARAARVTVVIRSTVLPGMSVPLMEAVRERAPGVDWAWAYWPSFAREAFAFEDELAPHAVVVGCTPGSRARDELAPVLEQLAVPPRWVSFAEAELSKYGSNLFNGVKISFYNALGAWAGKIGADAGTVAALVALASEASWNPDYGFRTMGRPFGGQCLPKDLEAFIAWLGDEGLPHAAVLEAARAVNEELLSAMETPAAHAR